MKTTRSPLVFCAVFLMLLGISVHAVAAPVPPLVSERNHVWEKAWETAWETAWQTPADLTVEFSGDVQSLDGMEFTVEFHDGSSGDEPLQLSWGLPEAVPQSSAGMVASFGLPWAQERAYTQELRLGKLFVDATPADARIKLLNADKQFRQGMDLSAGTYVIEVVCDGYEAQVRRVEVLEGMAATVRMDLMQVADAGSALTPASSYLPPSPEAATADQLAKDLATPADASSRPTAPGAVAQSAAPAQDLPTRPAALGSLQLAAADSAAQPADAQRQQRATAGQIAQKSMQSAQNVAPEVDRQPVTTAAAVSGKKGTLRVSTTPVDAQVRILDIKPKFQQGIALEPGTYTIDAQLYGYRTVEREIVIKPGQETSLDIALDELPEGRLYVKTTPENAYVRILDIRPRFEQGMDLAEGEYTIDATVSGYKTVEKKVRVTGGQDTVVEVELEQVAPTGRLYVDTLPADADIRVLGIMPKFYQGIELAEGTYTIDARTDGGERVEMQVQVTADRENRYTMALNDTNTQPGRLYVQTAPAGATVRILDITPRFEQGMLLEPGVYTIDVASPGHAPKVQTISVLPGRETRVSVALQAQGPVAQEHTVALQGPITEEPLVAEPDALAGPASQTGMAAGDTASAATEQPATAPVVAAAQTGEAEVAENEEAAALNVEATEAGVRELDIEIFLSMAELAYNAGDYVGALDSSAQVLNLDPGNIKALELRSRAFMELGQYSDALNALDTALAKNPENQQLLAARQELLNSRDQRKQNESSGSTSISLDPGYYQIKMQ